MSKQTPKSPSVVAPRTPILSAKAKRRPLFAALAVLVLAGYIAAAYFLLGPLQPSLWQRLIGLGCAILTLMVYLILTRRKESTDAIIFRARLAQRSDFGKHQLQAWLAKQQRTVKLPLVGETSLRLLGGIAVFALTIIWWLTPLAPVRVQEGVLDDPTVSLGEEIAAAMLVVPDGQIAVLASPTVPPRARELAELIKEDADAYHQGLKAIAERRPGDARAALKAALNDGKVDSAQVQLALAQNEMYAGLSADAAKLFETLVEQRPDDVMAMVQGAIAWLHAGAVDNAEPLVARAIKVCQGKPGEHDHELAYCLHAQSLLRIAQGRQFKEAEDLCAEARELIKRSTEQSLSLLGAILNNEAVLYLLEGEYSGASGRFKEADYWNKGFGSSYNPLVAANSCNQAVLYILLGEYRKAEEALSRAEDICRELLPKDHPLVAYNQTGRALLYEALGRYPEGLSCATDALTIVEKAFGRTHPTTIPALNVLAKLQADQAQYYKAEALCQRATDLSRRVWGLQHPFYAQMLARRAEIDVLQNRPAEAEVSCQKAYEIFSSLFGKKHPDVANALSTWGKANVEQQRPADARTHFSRALSIREEVFEKEHPSIAGSLGDLASLDNSPRTYGHGESLYRRAINMCESLLGDEHPEVARLLCGEGILFTAQEKFAQATNDLDQALAIQERMLTPFHPDLAVTLDAYAALLKAGKSSEPQRAAEMVARAKSIRQKHEQIDQPE